MPGQSCDSFVLTMSVNVVDGNFRNDISGTHRATQFKINIVIDLCYRGL